MHKKSYLTLIIACSLLLASCATNTPAAAPTQAPEELNTQIAQTIAAAIAQTAAAQPVVAATATSIPTQVPPTPTPQPIVTSTPFVIPTQLPLTHVPTSNAPAANQYPGDHCQWLYNHPMDGSGYKSGDSFQVDWGIFNNGNTTWTNDYSLRYVSGTVIYGNADIPLASNVLPGGKIELFIPTFPPEKAGRYISYWGLYNAAGQQFCLFYIYFIILP